MRLATSDDVTKITQIVGDAYSPFVERIGRAPAPMSVDYSDVVARGSARVLVDDGEVVGVLVIRTDLDHLSIENVAVAPRAQGQGHGRALLSDAEGLARECGLSELRLYTNEAMTENLRLYARLGYVEVDRRRVDGFSRVFFVRAVEPRG
ncbi:GNAT family N-acetyltransferase [Mycobacterium manitobense]|uniref:GNAT family N-acetyltransferase n=1 Tax=[Mycobacterium] manitobense TaxID=190147 RepID=A0A9X3BLT4_9MYCO|nr:GNAT family N-acetyltransferase [[Mycobacterium] manitobense]